MAASKKVDPRHLLKSGTKVRAFVQRNRTYVDAKTVGTLDEVNGTWVQVRTDEKPPRLLKVRPSQLDARR
jgi:hypothetical protein